MKTQTRDAFQIIADPSRRQMLRMLVRGSMTINSIAQNFAMSRPAVSRHVKILSDGGFIAIQDMGRERHCTLMKDGFEDLREFIIYFDQFWKNKLGRLQVILYNHSKNSSNGQSRLFNHDHRKPVTGRSLRRHQ